MSRENITIEDRLHAAGYNTERDSASAALDHVVGSDAYAWQAGLELTYPIGSRGDRARLLQATNNLSRARLQLRQYEQDILVSARSSVRAVETSREAVRVATLATGLGAVDLGTPPARVLHGAGLGEADARAAARALVHLTLGQVSEEQTRATLSEVGVVSGHDPEAAARDHAAGVALLLDGLAFRLRD